MNFGERLTKILNEKGMSITSLANETGITYNMIKKYCTTNSEPTVSYAEKMADVLGISLDELTGHVSKSKKSMFLEVFEEEMTYIKGFMRNVRRFADKTAVIDPLSETVLSYSELNKIVNQFANALNDQGIGYKDVVLYQLPNSLEYLYCYLAPQKLGAVNSPANYNFSPGETTVCLNLSRPKVYIYDGANKDIAFKALQAAEEKPQLILMVGDGDLPEGHQRFADFLNGYPESEPITDYVPNMYDEAMRLYTSGTTGKPKGVPLYNANEVMSAHDVMMHFPMNPTDSTINTTPWFHRGGIHSGGPCPTLYAGATVVIMKTFQSLLALKYVEKYKITFLIGVPSIIKMLVRHQEKYKADLSSLRGIITMGAPFERADC